MAMYDNRNTLTPVDPPHLVRARTAVGSEIADLISRQIPTPLYQAGPESLILSTTRRGHGTTRSQTTFAIVSEGSRWPESADRRGAEQAVGELAAFDYVLLQRDVDMLVADYAGSFVGRE